MNIKDLIPVHDTAIAMETPVAPGISVVDPDQLFPKAPAGVQVPPEEIEKNAIEVTPYRMDEEIRKSLENYSKATEQGFFSRLWTRTVKTADYMWGDLPLGTFNSEALKQAMEKDAAELSRLAYSIKYAGLPIAKGIDAFQRSAKTVLAVGYAHFLNVPGAEEALKYVGAGAEASLAVPPGTLGPPGAVVTGLGHAAKTAGALGGKLIEIARSPNRWKFRINGEEVPDLKVAENLGVWPPRGPEFPLLPKGQEVPLLPPPPVPYFLGSPETLAAVRISPSIPKYSFQTFDGFVALVIEPRFMSPEELAAIKDKLPKPAIVPGVDIVEGGIRIFRTPPLPKHLNKPVKKSGVAIEFESDIDKAAWFASRKTPTAPVYRRWLEEQNLGAKEIDALITRVTQLVSDKIAGMSPSATSVTIPQQTSILRMPNQVKANINSYEIADATDKVPTPVAKKILQAEAPQTKPPDKVDPRTIFTAEPAPKVEPAAAVEAEMTVEELYARAVAKLGHGEASARLQAVGVQAIRHGDGSISVLNLERLTAVTDATGREIPPGPTIPPPADKVITGESVERAANIRTDLIGIKGSFEDIVKETAEQSGFFTEARKEGGHINPKSLEAISELVGIPPSDLIKLGLGRTHFSNNIQLDIAYAGMIKAATAVGEAGRAVKESGGSVNAMMDWAHKWLQLSHAMDFVSGITAEAGRTLQAIQKFMALGSKETSAVVDIQIAKAKGMVEKMKAEKGIVTPDTITKVLKEEEGALFVSIGKNGEVANKTPDQLLQEFLFAHFGPKATLEEMKRVAELTAQMTPKQIVRLSKDRRLFKEYTIGEKLVSGIQLFAISGPFSQARYSISNITQLLLETATTLGQAGVAKLMRALGAKSVEDVSFTRPLGTMFGIVSAFPGALVAAAKAARWNWHIPTDAELARFAMALDLNATKATTQAFVRDYFQLAGLIPQYKFKLAPIWLLQQGVDRFNAFQMTLFHHWAVEAARLGYAFEQTTKEGISLLTQPNKFWRRVNDHQLALPTQMEDAAIAFGRRVTFMEQINPDNKFMSTLQRLRQELPAARALIWFMQIPYNTVKIAVEMSPARLFSPTFYKAIRGELGQEARTREIAKVMTGALTIAYLATMVEDEILLGSEPADPKAKAIWRAQGKRPYTIRIGDKYYDYSFLGPLANLMAWTADAYMALKLTSLRLSETDLGHIEKYEKEIAARLTSSASQTLNNMSFGMLADIIGIINDPQDAEHKWEKLAGNLVPTIAVPQFFQQIGRAMDPNMRELNSVLDRLQNAVPFAREALPEKLDWMGRPVPNTRYGIFHSLFPASEADESRIAKELAVLDVMPSMAPTHIVDIRLTPEQRHELQLLIGKWVKPLVLEAINKPTWPNIKEPVRKEILQALISQAHELGRGEFIAAHPEFIQQMTKDKVEWYTHGTGRYKPLEIIKR